MTEVQRILAVATPAVAASRSTSRNGNETAELLAGVGQKILCIDPISPDQRYFDLSGESSLAVQMFAQIEKIFKIKLPLATSIFSANAGCGCALDFGRQGVM